MPDTNLTGIARKPTHTQATLQLCRMPPTSAAAAASPPQQLLELLVLLLVQQRGAGAAINERPQVGRAVVGEVSPAYEGDED